jgi:hypothetical protein
MAVNNYPQGLLWEGGSLSLFSITSILLALSESMVQAQTWPQMTMKAGLFLSPAIPRAGGDPGSFWSLNLWHHDGVLPRLLGELLLLLCSPPTDHSPTHCFPSQPYKGGPAIRPF